MDFSKYYDNMKLVGFVANLDCFHEKCKIIFNTIDIVGAGNLLAKFIHFNIFKFDYLDCVYNTFNDNSTIICNSSGKVKLLDNKNKVISTVFFSETFIVSNNNNKITHYILKFHS